MEFEIGGDYGGREFGVCGCPGAGTPYWRGSVAKLFPVLWEDG